MGVQVSGGVEAGLTDMTRVWFHAGVCSGMSGEITGGCKCCIAIFAMVWFFSGVGPHVQGETGCV